MQLDTSLETVFAPSYEKLDWSGNLFAYPIDEHGVVNLAAERWSGGASARVDFQHYDTGRLIVTLKDNGSRIPFRWTELSNNQQSSLGNDHVLLYIRGDRANEAPNGDKYRFRKSVFGDIVHSRPYYVHDEVNPRVYVGANDGMLHAFGADTGAEVFAYVPSMLIPNLDNLTAAAFTHT